MNEERKSHKSDDTPQAGNDVQAVGLRLAQLGEDTVVTESDLAQIIGRHRVSIRRAVERGELPAPFRAFGRPSWTVQKLLDHFHGLQASAATSDESQDENQ